MSVRPGLTAAGFIAAFVFVCGTLLAAPGRHVKLLVEPGRDDRALPESTLTEHGASTLADYGRARVVAVPEVAYERLSDRLAMLGFEVRMMEELIHTPRRAIDSRLDKAPATPFEAGLFLLQYAAPPTSQWQAEVRASGAVRIETLPERAVVLAATAQQIARIARRPWVQYLGPYLPEYKFAPVGDMHRGEFTIQMADTPLSAEAVARVEERVGGFQSRSRYDGQLMARFASDVETAQDLLEEPFVLGVETYIPPQPSDERQALSVTSVASVPSGAYLTWLSGRGITPNALTNSGIVVDIADTGVDMGCQSHGFSGHPDLMGRIVYHNGPVGGQRSPKFVDLEGHGTVVATIIGGNPSAGINTAGSPTMGIGLRDVGAFFYGMGVAPGVRIGSTVMMQAVESVSVQQLTTLAVTQRCNTPLSSCPTTASGPLCPATVQNHSNNENDGTGTYAGYYSSSAREFDISVRNADRATMVPLAVTVSAGNFRQEGNDFTSKVLAPATAKNVISVGAVESKRPTPPLAGSFPACLNQGIEPASRHSAEGFNVLAYVSRRGTVDGRLKPDLLAPATLSLGGHTFSLRDQAFCAKDQTAVDSYPEYHGTSGTSFAAPVAAGSIALLRYYFKTNYGLTPSPALYKAMLVAGARSIKGGVDRQAPGATVTGWPNEQQGFGVITLDKVLVSGGGRWLDQTVILQQSQIWERSVAVSNPALPVRIVLAWTDAPGAVQQPNQTLIKALVNDLDLRGFLPDGAAFWGNLMDASGFSRVPGGCGRPLCPSSADLKNNVEMLNIDPARFTNIGNRTFTIRVTAPGILGVGVPGASGGANNQDFAVFIVNGTML